MRYPRSVQLDHLQLCNSMYWSSTTEPKALKEAHRLHREGLWKAANAQESQALKKEKKPNRQTVISMFEAEWMLSVRHVVSPAGPMHEQQGHTLKGAGEKLKKKKGRALQLLAEATLALLITSVSGPKAPRTHTEQPPELKS